MTCSRLPVETSQYQKLAAKYITTSEKNYGNCLYAALSVRRVIASFFVEKSREYHKSLKTFSTGSLRDWIVIEKKNKRLD